MEVQLEPDLEAKLTQMAARQGRDTAQLLHEAVERFVDYDEWFVNEVEKGLAEAERGELIDHDEVVARIERHLRGKQPSM